MIPGFVAKTYDVSNGRATRATRFVPDLFFYRYFTPACSRQAYGVETTTAHANNSEESLQRWKMLDSRIII